MLNTEPTFSLCVYCGSRPGNDARYLDAATAVGQWIGHHGGQLVYGGGRTGLMGQVAEATRQAGGRVVGIIPQALVDREVANPLCDAPAQSHDGRAQPRFFGPARRHWDV